MPWLQAHLQVSGDQAPLLEHLFETLGAVSTTLIDAADEPQLEPAPGETPIWSATRVTGLFPLEIGSDTLRSAINQALNTDTSSELDLEILADQDWERAWLDNFQPMKFGQRLWICPTGMQVPEPEAVVISLDPGLAFGTGTHPTTALCLAWLDSADIQGKTVIDFGCGSGVLGIAALKLGAEKVIAVDHDPQAILATTENARRNGVSGQLQAVLTKDFQPVQADIVLANILANILISLATTLIATLKQEGILVLSGILEQQASSVTTTYATHLDFDATALDGWLCLTGTPRT